ncbi:serine hydrolase domain-containing protein [Alkalicaulis satelles]|nr:serine hydrolase [Alkalicaulis satelles]
MGMITTALGAGLAGLMLSGAALAQEAYLPARGDDQWERRDAAAMGFDAEALQGAIDFAIANETRHDPELEAVSPARDLTVSVPLTWAFEPHSSPIGPLAPRGAPSGVIVRGGYIVAEWGEPERADMTFSITKTALSHVVGLAVDDGLIASVDDAVAPYVDDARFHTDHNAPVTWDQMLRQTSGWWGELYGKPAWADRPSREDPASKLRAGPPEPGAAYEYNDVRVNALALAALHVFGEELPDVFRARIMDPIGASDTWSWRPYDNAQVEISGRAMMASTGGGHWGGGLFISAYDLARLGLFGLHRGSWGDDRLLSDSWFEASLTPGEHAPGYGYMNFFLNQPDGEGPGFRVANAPAAAFAYLGAGTNVVFVSPEHDLVVVVRWIDRLQTGAVLEQIMAAILE